MKKMVITLWMFLFSTCLFAADKPETPGKHNKIKCEGSEYTYSVYIPKAYAEKTDKNFPVVYLQSPGGNPGFMKLESWAEEREFLIICINGYSNDTFKDQDKAQAAVWKSAAHLRMHHSLRFACGFSGAGWASVNLANRYPKNLAGVTLFCHSGNGAYAPKGCSVTFLYGGKDKTHPPSAVESAMAWYRARKYHMNSKIFPEMGHKVAPVEDRIAMLNFMYDYQKYANSELTDEERASAWVELEKEFTEINKGDDLELKLRKFAEYLVIPKLLKQKIAKVITSAWQKAAVEHIAKLENRDAYIYINTTENMAKLAKLSGKPKGDYRKLLSKIKRDPEIRKEEPAMKAFLSIEKALLKVKAKGDKKKLAKIKIKLSKLTKKYPDTIATEKAETIIATL